MKMDCKNQPTPSVIETLMGLNTQLVQKRQRKRVLSENYVQKTSSLHFSQKSSPSRSCSSEMQVDAADLVPNMRFMDQFSDTDYQIRWSDSMFRSTLQDSQDASLHPRHSWVMKAPNPCVYKNSLVPKPSPAPDAKKSQQKHGSSKPMKGRFSVNKCKIPEQDFTSEIVYNKTDSPKISDSWISSLLGNRIMKDGNLSGPVPAKGNWTMTHRSLIHPRAHCDTNWHLVNEEASRSTPAETSLLISECSGTVLSCNLEPVSMMSENGCVKVSCSNESKIRSGQNVYDESKRVDEMVCVSSSFLDSSRPKDCKMSLDNQTDDISSSGATQIEHLICDADNNIYQEASQELPDDTLASCQTPDSEPPSPTSSEEVSRCSPISVLESLSKGGVPSTMDCFMNGSTDLYEAYTEGLEMTVSSDEDYHEESTDTIDYNAELSDISYLASMLDVACGHGDVNYNVWPSFESPITPLVFQILEEKYGRHISWPRSHRKLLFDRINLGLTDFANSCFGIRRISASVRQRFCPSWTRKEVEENLWRLLVIQDKEASKSDDIRPPIKGKSSTAKKGKKTHTVTCKGVKASTDDFSFYKLEDYMDEVIMDLERSIVEELLSESL